MWKNIRCKGIASVEKLVGEYNIWELEKSPYGKFKIRIYQKKDNFYAGYTNGVYVPYCMAIVDCLKECLVN